MHSDPGINTLCTKPCCELSETKSFSPSKLKQVHAFALNYSMVGTYHYN